MQSFSAQTPWGTLVLSPPQAQKWGANPHPSGSPSPLQLVSISGSQLDAGIPESGPASWPNFYFPNVFVMQWHFNIKQIYIYLFSKKRHSERSRRQTKASTRRLLPAANQLRQEGWGQSGDREPQPPCLGFKLEQTDFLVRELQNKLNMAPHQLHSVLCKETGLHGPTTDQSPVAAPSCTPKARSSSRS